jgi:hypothetical protein
VARGKWQVAGGKGQVAGGRWQVAGGENSVTVAILYSFLPSFVVVREDNNELRKERNFILLA